MEEHLSNTTNCLNCGHPMTQDAIFCSNCSQKNTDGRITIRSFFANIFESIFNVDSKVFRTLRDLFIPGKLTKEFFKGKHQTYLHPVRFFLAITILLITALNFNRNDDDDGNSMIAELKAEIEVQQLKRKADTIRQKIQLDFPESKEAIDSFYVQLIELDSTYSDSTEVVDIFYSDSILVMTTKEPIRYKKEDFINMTPNELVEKYYPDNSFMNKLLSKQVIRVMKQGRDFAPYLIDKISWLMLISIPFFAIFLKLFYWRHNLYYIEHLVFTIHVHTLLFLLWIIAILMNNWIGKTLAVVFFISAGVYILFAMKRVYEQPWKKTILKFALANFTYWIILAIGIIITGVLSFFLF